MRAHGPHVDSRDKPEQSFVTLDVIIPSLRGRKATIRRTVKAVSAPTITPNDPDVLAAFANVKLHPEFVLSRRELIRYVLSEPGQRSKEVQALLRLDDIEKLRTVLQKISNACTRELPALERTEKEAVTHLLTALGIAQLSKSSVLGAVNPKRVLLGLPELTALEATTSVKDGLATASASVMLTRVPKIQATGDLATLKAALEKLTSGAVAELCVAVEAAAAELSKDTASIDAVSREALLQSAINLYDEKVCPVCDTPFEPEHFRQHLAEKLKHLEEITLKRTALEAQISSLMDVIHAAGTALATVIGYGAQLNPPVEVASLQDFKVTLAGRYGQLQKLFPLEDTRAVLLSACQVPDLNVTIAGLTTAIAAIPEPTKQDAARDFLVVAQERLEQYRGAKQKVTIGTSRAGRSSKVFDLYADVTTKALEGIYNNVEEAFSAFYRKINHQDESTFTAKLMPSIGKLGFDVDFYGRGQFPPGAYHSEGHQDGMGLCLYLALMRHLLGDNFTFAVLDDVLMSVDVGHRREVCTLLKEQFPKTQFIFTTHDEIWLRHMKSEGLIKGRSFAHFRTWNVDMGPTEWSDRDVWAELDAHVAKNDIRAAAALLRHYLEHFAKESCDRLRASVEFRGDAQFMLGDLLPNATGALGDHFKKAKAAANSWGQKDVMATVEAREQTFTDSKRKTGHEQWQINTAVHFNEWADLNRNDFEPVVKAFKSFTEAFTCSQCEEMFYISPEKGGAKEALRCGCGAINFNLIIKSL